MGMTYWYVQNLIQSGVELILECWKILKIQKTLRNHQNRPPTVSNEKFKSRQRNQSYPSGRTFSPIGRTQKVVKMWHQHRWESFKILRFLTIYEWVRIAKKSPPLIGGFFIIQKLVFPSYSPRRIFPIFSENRQHSHRIEINDFWKSLGENPSPTPTRNPTTTRERNGRF